MSVQLSRAVQSVAVVIQAAAKNWSGGNDHSVLTVEGTRLVELVLEKAKRLAAQASPGATPILAIPDLPHSRGLFTELASEHDVSVFFGSPGDVLERLIACAEAYDTEAIARINGSYWYLDEETFERMLAAFRASDADLLRVPRSFPHGFAAEFVRTDALARLQEIQRRDALGPISSPTSTMEAYPDDFSVEEFTDSLPSSSPGELTRIRAGRRQYEPERIEFDRSLALDHASTDLKRYQRALGYLSPTDRVLDIACGEGFGCDLVAARCAEVVGADYDAELVESVARVEHPANVSFAVEDITAMGFPDGSFDAVISMETVEHVDEDLFVAETARVLRPGGLLIVSTPQNDWGFNVVPWHVREYSVAEIRTLLEPAFEIVKVHGVSSHEILEDSEAGDRMLVIAKKRG